MIANPKCIGALMKVAMVEAREQVKDLRDSQVQGSDRIW